MALIMALDIKAKCPYDNIASEVCVSRECNRFNPFICNNICKDSMCYSNHHGCKFMSWTTCKKKLASVQIDKDEAWNEFVAEVEEVYDKLIGNIESEKQKFRAWHTTVGLNPKIVKFLGEVSNGRYSTSSGSQLYELLREGNPPCPEVRIKNLTKVDNLYFK